MDNSQTESLQNKKIITPDNVFKYPKLKEPIISVEDKAEVKSKIKHNYDPFGDAYIGLINAISMYKMFNIPNDIIQSVISWLDFYETTMDLRADGIISDPIPSYGTEAFINISPPLSTHLPSNCYILNKVRYKVRKGSRKYNNGEIFIGIQIFDIDNIQIPGKGDVLFTKQLRVTGDDEYFTINPMITLKCGISYIFWITCVSGKFDGPLVNGNAQNAMDKRKELKLTYSDLMYYARQQYNDHSFSVRKRYMNCYDIWFTPKI
eukprot:318216_1